MSQETPKPPVQKFLSGAIQCHAALQATLQRSSDTQAVSSGETSDLVNTPSTAAVPKGDS
jgi:hypothetical protein